MLKKIFRDAAIVFGLFVLCLSTSQKAMVYLWEKRKGEAWWSMYDWRNGDLVGMSYLDMVKIFARPQAKPVIRYPSYVAPKNTVLYLHGDSYARHLNDSAFAGLASYHYIHRPQKFAYRLDTTKRNILLLEVSERLVRSYFGKQWILKDLYDSNKIKSTATIHSYAHEKERLYASILTGITIDYFFNKYINQNLQCNLFNYNFIMPVFGTKAAINYYIFKRADGNVVISNNGKHLFLKETVSLTDSGSSYIPIEQEEITELVNNFNAIYDHYLADGFTGVYLSVIPNPATIIQPEGYNGLIPRIQNDPKLKMKTIDVYSAFKSSTQLNYLPGDTHWNDAGRQLWLDLVNKKLACAGSRT